MVRRPDDTREPASDDAATLLRAIVDNTPDTVYVKDDAGRYLLINAAGAAVLGRNPEEIVGRSDSDLFTPEIADDFVADDRAVKAGEGATALLMLANVFLLLVCYSILKTVREPLILLGGGAEVRSYAAAGQALLLIGFVPLYSWFSARVNRARLLTGMGLFFIAGLELFAAATAAHVPFVGVAFFIWLGIFNISLVAQFWSFANDLYTKEAGARLFPIIMMGMTAGAPLGSFVAARLFRSGITPPTILHVAALLLAITVGIYLAINARAEHRATEPRETLAEAAASRWCWRARICCSSPD